MIQALRRTPHGDTAPPRNSSGGFTLIELLTVIVIIGVISAYVATRGTSLNADLSTRLSEVRSQLRFLQLTAMKRATPMGLQCDGTSYWARYAANSTIIQLPAESNATVSLASKSMTMTTFFVSFDANGIPYTVDNATKLTNAHNSTISITAGGQTGSLTVTPETGFVQ